VLVTFLRANAEVFAWSPSDMPGIPRDVAEHSLDIRAGARPVKQPLRRFDEEKRRVIGEEIHKLTVAGFIKEVFHPEWLANPVLVKKKGGKWRMCVDYTGLNKACPKVPYPLPRIDQIVDSTAGCETLSFLDAYSFGLRKAGATYQRCMNHVFGEHIGRTVEAYVDDIVVKTRKASDLLSDLETTFKCLRAKGVKLNPEKCVFGVPRGMLLGFIVSERGIEANHIRVDWAAVAHPMTNGQVERANGMLLQGLKPRIYNDLNKFGKRWMKELPSVVWSLRTTPSRATGFSSFFLVYGAEAILPTDLEYGSPRTRAYDDQSNRTSREDSLDQLEEARDMALLHSARYQQSLRRYHDRGVRSRDLQVGGLVLRLRQDARGRHKLTPPWEGPFIIAKILMPGTYKLANSQGEVYNNAWNIRQLRRFYT
jgi:hypothetical protein